MRLSDTQRRVIRAIVSVFEVGKPAGDAGRLVLAKGDTGGLSWGSHQSTRASGSLALCVREYVARGGRYAPELAPFLPRLSRRDPTLDRDKVFRSLLQKAGRLDPIAREAQDHVFETKYFEPAMAHADRLGLTSALAAAVCYDGYIHGSFPRFANALGRVSASLPEREWLARYLLARRDWLRQSKPPLPATVYRPDTFLALLEAGNLELALPVRAHGVMITQAAIGAGVAESAAAYAVSRATKPASSAAALTTGGATAAAATGFSWLAILIVVVGALAITAVAVWALKQWLEAEEATKRDVDPAPLLAAADAVELGLDAGISSGSETAPVEEAQ